MSMLRNFSVKHLLFIAGFGMAVVGSALLGHMHQLVARADTRASSLTALPVSTPVAATVAGATVEPDPVKIMVVGDSISHGHSGDYTWRYRLWQHLKSHGVLFDFVGPKKTVYDETNAASTAYLDPNFDDTDHDATWGRFTKDEKNTIAGYVSTYTPDILLIELGTNDLAWLGMTGQQVAGEMSTLINNARSAKPNVKIILSKATPILGSSADYNGRRMDYNGWLPLLAASMTTQTSPIIVADPTTGFDPAVDTYDSVHPSPSGEYKLAAAFANALANPEIGVGTTYGVVPPVPAWPAVTQSVWSTLTDNGVVALGWNAVPGTSQYASGYYVYMRPVGGSFTLISPLVTGTSYTYNSPLAPHTVYEFAISTVRVSAIGPLSAVTRFDTTPALRNRPPSDSYTPAMPGYTPRPAPDPDTSAMPGTPTSGGRTRPGSTTPNFPY